MPRRMEWEMLNRNIIEALFFVNVVRYAQWTESLLYCFFGGILSIDFQIQH